MKRSLLGLIAVLLTGLSFAQNPDSVVYVYHGTHGEMQEDLDEIVIHPTCKCIGACQCKVRPEKRTENRAFANADEVLNSISEVDLIKRGNFASEPIVNGISGDRISMTIDGMKIFGACTDKMDPISSYIEPNNLRAIQVHSNGSSMNGSSTGGSINFQTREVTIDSATPWKAQVGTAYSTVSRRWDKLASIQYSHKKWAILVNGVHKKSENFRAGNGVLVPYTQFEKWNVASSIKYRLTKNQILKVTHVSDRGYNIGYAALPMDVAYAKADIGSVSYLIYPSKKIRKVEIKGYMNSVRHAMDDSQREEVFMHMDMPGTTTTKGAYADVKWGKDLGKQSIRFDYFQARAKAEMTMFPNEGSSMYMLTWPDIVRNNYGLHYTRKLIDKSRWKLNMSGNFRYVTHEVKDEFGVRQAGVFGQDLKKMDHRMQGNLSVAASRKWKNGKLWLELSEAQRAPTFTEQYGFYIFNAYDGFDYIGNVDLHSETSLRTSMGYKRTIGPMKFSASAFAIRFNNYILPVIDGELDAMTWGANGVKKSENISGTNMCGGNVAISYFLHQSLSIDLSSNYVRGRTGNMDPLPLIPPWRSKLLLKWKQPRYNVVFEVVRAEAQNRVNPDFGELQTPAYTIVNLKSNWKRMFGEHELRLDFGIDNILDMYYRTHLTWGGIPNPGRNVSISAMMDL